MKELFVNYEIAKQLKEKGFAEECLAYYHIAFGLTVERKVKENLSGTGTETLAPLYQQVVDWFREKHKIHIEMSYDPYHVLKKDNHYSCVATGIDGTFHADTLVFGKDYYTVLDESITEALKLI